MNTLTCTAVLKRNLPERAAELRERALELKAPEFAEVRREVQALEAAVRAVIEQEAREAERLISQTRALFPTMQTFLTFVVNAGRAAVQEQLDDGLATINQIVSERLAPHAGVPAKLEGERDAVRDQAATLRDLLPEVRELGAIEDWQGEAAENYRRAATVQASALSEYAGMTDAEANALDRVALLNRATFFLAAEEIRFTKQQILALPPGNPFRLFAHSSAAAGHLQALAARLIDELDKVEDGEVAKGMADELTKSLDVPNLLLPTGWPTGGDASATAPADTATAIKPADDE